MKFNIYFMIVFSIFFSIIYTLYIKKFELSLKYLDPKSDYYDENYYERFLNFKKERIEILTKSSIIVFIILIIFYFLKIKADTFINTVYMYICIYFLIIYFIYNLYPKKNEMHTDYKNEWQSIDNDYDDDNDSVWFNTTIYLKFHFHIGLLIGFFISIIILFIKSLLIKKS
jgi:hypothetical protein